MAATDFSEQRSDEMSLWVIDHGLPALPADLQRGQSVPVAYWVGPSTAAVLHIRWSLRQGFDERPVETDVVYFRRTGSTWGTPIGSGGGGWRDTSPLTGVEVAATEVNLHGLAGAVRPVDGGCTALFGVVGVDAAFAEVEQAGVLTRRPVQAPIGVFVVCAEGNTPFTVRVFDAVGEMLHEHVEPVFTTPDRPAGFRRERVIHGPGGTAQVSSTWGVSIRGRHQDPR